MQTAKLYQPSVVFFEDVDTVSDPQDQSQDDVSKLLDVFDGIQSKDTKIIVVLTTNHVERIHKGMVRPGRLDAVIHVGELDTDGFIRLIHSLVPLDKLGSLNKELIGEAFAGFLPAFAAEAINRAVRYSIARNHGEVGLLNTEDFVEAAEGLRPQLELMHEAKERAEVTAIDAAFQNIVKESLDDTRIIAEDYYTDNDEFSPFKINTKEIG
jgi:transitional endoplasmic reticulum ATPase